MYRRHVVATEMTAIRTSGLTKVRRPHRRRRPRSHRRRRRVFGFPGPERGGKSTTINMLLDFARPTAGSATVLGYDAQTEADEIQSPRGRPPRGSTSIRASRVGATSSSPARRKPPATIRTKSSIGSAFRPGRLNRPATLLEGDAPAARDRHGAGRRPRPANHGRALRRTRSPRDPRDAGTRPQRTERGTTVFFSKSHLRARRAVCDRIGVLNERGTRRRRHDRRGSVMRSAAARR